MTVLSKGTLAALRTERSSLREKVAKMEAEIKTLSASLVELDRLLANGNGSATRTRAYGKRAKATSRLKRGWGMNYAIYIAGNLKTAMTLKAFVKHARHKMPMAYRVDSTLDDQKLMSRLSASLFNASQKGLVQIDRKHHPHLYGLTAAGRKVYAAMKKEFEHES